MPRKLLILGAGGMAREVSWLVNDINKAQQGNWSIVGFLERATDRNGLLLNGIPIIDFNTIRQDHSELYAVVAIGDPMIRERAVTDARSLGVIFATLVHPNVRYDQSTVNIAPGAIICAGSIITVNINIGMHVITNLGCTIGHDTIIEDYVTLSPGCHISGKNILRRSSFFGTGSVTTEKCDIGERSIIGAGAVVVGSLPNDITAVGIPARPINNK